MMISILTLLDNKTSQLPDDAAPLFDDNSPLSQLQLDDLWLNQGNTNWQCHPSILNCQTWAEAWSHIHLSPLSQQLDVEDKGLAQKVVILISGKTEPQLWYFFAQPGLLQSPANNWYQIPPSQREALTPIIKAEAIEQ